jgi:proteasome lid subunit RPN8/RPN11
MVLEASKDMHPNEFGAMLRAEEGVIMELVLLPGTVSGRKSAHFQFHMMPPDRGVVGTIHSHPNGVTYPSEADQALYSKFGGIHIITGWPYGPDNWAVFTNKGEKTSLEVVGITGK